MSYIKVSITGVPKTLTLPKDNFDTVSDCCEYVENLIGSNTRLIPTLFGDKISGQAVIDDVIPDDSLLILNPEVPTDPSNLFMFENIYYPEENIKYPKFILFSTVNLHTMNEGDEIEITSYEHGSVINEVGNFLWKRYGVSKNKQIHIFFSSGCPFLSGTLNDFIAEFSAFRPYLYVIITNYLEDYLLDKEIEKVCDISSHEMKSLISPIENSSDRALCTMASILGYINGDAEGSEELEFTFSKFFKFVPFLCAFYQIRNSYSINGRVLIQFTAPFYAILKELLPNNTDPKTIYEYAPKYLKYFLNFNLRGTVPCIPYIKIYYEIGIEKYLKKFVNQNVVVLWEPDHGAIDWVFFKLILPNEQTLKNSEENIDTFSICNPLELHQIQNPVLFEGVNGPWLFLIPSFSKDYKDKGKKLIINPETGKSELVDVEEFAKMISKKTGIERLVDPDRIEQIVFLLLDKSSSMFDKTNLVNGNITRYQAALQYLTLFVDKVVSTFSFSLYGMYCFSDDPEKICDLTIFSNDFINHVLSCMKFEEGGLTNLFKTVDEACDQIIQIQKQFPKAIPRIIILTDGKDTKAVDPNLSMDALGNIYRDADIVHFDLGIFANKLVQNKIRVDSVYIIDKFDKDDLDGRLFTISKITGGCSFCPLSLEDGREIFQQEAFYNVKIRKFNDFQVKNYTCDEIQKTLEQHRDPNEYDKVIPCKSIDDDSKKEILQSQNFARKYNGKIGDNLSQRNKAILREIRHVNSSHLDNIKLFLNNNTFDEWKILLCGPENSPYFGRWFYLSVKFSKQYPKCPPEFRFVKPPFHPNINDNGKICLSILDRDYNANDTVNYLLEAIIGLLLAPNPQDPIDIKRGEICKPENQKQYQSKIEEYNRKNSYDTAEEWIKEWQINSTVQIADKDDIKGGQNKRDEDIDPRFICPFSRKIMKDPVRATSGVCFDRNSLERQLKLTDHLKCPQTGKELKKEENMNLPTDFDMKARINEWIQNHK